MLVPSAVEGAGVVSNGEETEEVGDARSRRFFLLLDDGVGVIQGEASRVGVVGGGVS